MLKIRLRRMGSTHKPFYRVVVSDSRRTPTASAIEEIGYYDPRKKPSVLAIDVERIDYWKGKGALLSDAVTKLVNRKPEPEEKPAEETEPEKAEAKEPEKAEAKEPEKAEAKKVEKSDESDKSDKSDESDQPEAQEAEKAQEETSA